LSLAYGGTNKNIAAASNGAVVYSDADSFELTGVGSSGQYLRSAGAATPMWSVILSSELAGANLPGGSTSYIQNAGATLQSGATFYVSSGTVDEVLMVKGTGVAATNPAFQVIGGTLTVLANGNVGIGTASPSQKLHVEGLCVTGDTLIMVRLPSTSLRTGRSPQVKATKASRSLPSPLEGEGRVRGSSGAQHYEEVPIVNLKPGDQVLSLNEKTKKIEPHRVNGLLYMGVKPVFTLKTASGKQIRTTGNHPYLTRSGWRKVVDIKVGEEIAVPRQEALHGSNSNNPLDSGNYFRHGGAGQSAQSLSDQLLIQRNDLGQFDQRGLRQTGGFKIQNIQKIIVAGERAGNVRGNGQSDNVLASPIKLRRRDNDSGALLEGGKIGKREGDQDDVALFISGHRLYRPDYSRNQKNSLQLSEAQNLRRVFSADEANPTINASDFQARHWRWLVQFLQGKAGSSWLYLLVSNKAAGFGERLEFYALPFFGNGGQIGNLFIREIGFFSGVENYFGQFMNKNGLIPSIEGLHFLKNLFNFTAHQNLGLNLSVSEPPLPVKNAPSQVLWDKVISIKYSGREPVWDIEVEGTHNFIGNRIFAHNTYMSGNVGIGTTAPASKTHIFQAAGTGGSYLKVSSGAVDLLEVAGGSVTINAGTFYVKGAVDTAAGSGFNGWDTNASDDFAAGGILPGGATSYIQNAGATLQSGATFYISSGTVDEVLRVKGTNVSGTSPAFQVIGGTLTVLANGNVGIGTSGPGARLAVAGSLIASGSLKGGVNLSDLAENITASDLTIEAGDVVAADPGQIESIVKSRQPYEDRVLGVISTEPGMLINPQMSDFDVKAKYDPGQKPLVLAGRVPVKVTLENGPIAIGDRLTASSKPGYAMKATKSGRVVGIALEAFGDGGEAERQRGGAQEGKKPLTPTLSPLARGEGKMEEDKILAFINPHYWVNPDDYAALNDRVSRLETEIKLLKSETIIGKK
ncbi:MAG: hypothetical protein HY747_07565, partial [Elusimicrobia bacterium]|nr:hypothetical protein [Elusimicrobiota bacterium]